jgi:Spy/CpxP family protein refolding chaperone
MMKVRSIALCLSVAAFAAGVVGCAGTVEQPSQTASAVTKAPVATNAHGMVRLFGEALGEVPLRPDQRAEIEKLATEAEARHAPQIAARKQLMLTVADQVEKGAMDASALQTQLDAMTAGLAKARADDRAALAKLHALLDADQRNAFVDALEKQMKAKRGEHAGPPGFMKLKQLGDELKLTDEQRSQIKDVLHGAREDAKEAWKARGRDHRARRGEHPGKKALEAFRGETLELDAVAPPRDGEAMARFGTERMTAVAQKLVPILTPEQRTIAAAKLRSLAENGAGAMLVQ